MAGFGSIVLTNAGAQPVALTVGGNGQSTNYGGILSGGNGLTKVGSGTLTLTASQSYGGPTVISGGGLQLQGGGASSDAIIHYTFDSVNGATVPNSGTLGSTADGTLGNSTIVPGKIGNAISFNVANDSGVITNNKVTIGNAFSLSCWVSTTAANSVYSRIINNNYPNSAFLGTDNSNPGKYLPIVKNHFDASSQSVDTSGTWNMLTMTWDGTHCDLYYNGSLLSGYPVTYSGVDTSWTDYFGFRCDGNTVINGHGPYDESWIGKMDDAYVFTRAEHCRSPALLRAGRRQYGRRRQQSVANLHGAVDRGQRDAGPRRHEPAGGLADGRRQRHQQQFGRRIRPDRESQQRHGQFQRHDPGRRHAGHDRPGKRRRRHADPRRQQHLLGHDDHQRRRLQIGSGGTAGSLSTGSTIVDNGLLVFNRSDAVVQGTDFSAAAITGSGSLLQAGSGMLTLSASGTGYSGNTTVSAGVLNLNGATLGSTAGTSEFFIGPPVGAANAKANAAANLSGGAINVNSDSFPGAIAVGGMTKSGWLNMTGGAINFGAAANNWLMVGAETNNKATSGDGRFDMSGGTINLAAGSGYGGSGIIAGVRGAAGVINFSGNAQVNDSILYVQYGVSGGDYRSIVTQSGNAAVELRDATRGLHFNTTNAQKSVYNLNGGTLTTPIITQGQAGGVLNFNGGMLSASQSSANFMTVTTALLYSGGATINTGSNNITIGAALTAPALTVSASWAARSRLQPPARAMSPRRS